MTPERLGATNQNFEIRLNKVENREIIGIADGK